jgi:putative heme-binding domain-containing protein
MSYPTIAFGRLGLGAFAWLTILTLLGTVAVTPATAQAPPPEAARGPQAAGSGVATESGSELFARTCKVCHGEAGIGGGGPALRGSTFTRAYVRRAMSEGRAGSMMPEFTRTFTATQMNAVAEYVAALQTPAGPAGGELRGNAAAGEAIFFARGARSCHVCHSVGGRGGSVGPALSAKVAALSPREVLQRIILVPHRANDPAYATMRLTTTAGAILTGVKAGETDEVVHFYDTSSLPPILRTLPKSEIATEEPLSASVMPSDYASRLTLQQLLDLVSFLKSSAGTPVSVTLSEVTR